MTPAPPSLSVPVSSVLPFRKSSGMSVMSGSASSQHGSGAPLGATAHLFNREPKESGVGEGEGGGGGAGGWNCTTKDLVPWSPFAKEKLCPIKPGAAHSAPLQPSSAHPGEYEYVEQSPAVSVMSRVHVAPSATSNGELEAYGAPPLSVVLSVQLRLQATFSG
eukprot:scaffold58258_cov62-Phaeocystis_antarctica.AAC.2